MTRPKPLQPPLQSRLNDPPGRPALEEVLGSPATKTILTGIVSGIFGTRRRR